MISLDNDDALVDVRREIQTLSQCHHPNVVNYSGGTYFCKENLWVVASFVFTYSCHSLQIIMEYCGGGSVSDLCQCLEQGLREPQIAFICREALRVCVVTIYSSDLFWAGIEISSLTQKNTPWHQGRKHSANWRWMCQVRSGVWYSFDLGWLLSLADFGVSAQLQSTMSKRNTFVGVS